MEETTVIDFLLHKTDVGELCIIRRNGWYCQAVYIDSEDLCVLVAPSLENEIVKDDSFNNMEFTGCGGIRQVLQVHFIDI